MGLLDKALRGQVQTAEKAASPISGRAAFSLSADDLASLSREVASSNPTADYHLGIYALIASRLPLPVLGLLWQGSGGLVLAAGRGFSALGPRAVAADPFERIRGPFPVDDAILGLLSPQIGLGSGLPLRAQPCFDPEGSIKALWLYGAAGLDRASPELLLSLDAVFAAASSKANPPPPLEKARGLAGPELLREGRAKACALLFEFGAVLKEVEARGLRPAEALAAIGGGASRILGSSGAVFSPGPDRLLVLLFSSFEADAELSLAQFRKSLRRSLGILAPAAGAPARALALSLEDPGVSGEFDRFLRA